MTYDAIDYVLLLGAPALAAAGFYFGSKRQMNRNYRARITSGEPLTRIVSRNPEKPSSLAMGLWAGAATVVLGVFSFFFPEVTSVTPGVAVVGGAMLSGLFCLGANFRLSRMALSHFKI
jgi:hypothetical protein